MARLIYAAPPLHHRRDEIRLTAYRPVGMVLRLSSAPKGEVMSTKYKTPIPEGMHSVTPHLICAGASAVMLVDESPEWGMQP
jgi:hypothetical protein